MRLPTRETPGEFGHYVGMSVAERKVADRKMKEAKNRDVQDERIARKGRGLPMFEEMT